MDEKKESSSVSQGSKGEANGGAGEKDKIAIPFTDINSGGGSGCFSARIAVRQTQRKAFLFPMGQDRSIVRHWEEGESPRGFSGIAVWQTADVPYTRASPLRATPPSSPFSTPFSVFFQPSLPPSLPPSNPLRRLSPFYGLIVRLRPGSLRMGVFTIRQALSNAQMTLIDMSAPFFFFSSFCLLSSSPLPPLSFDASIPRDMHEDSIYEGMVRGVRYGFSCSTKWLTNGACKIRIENCIRRFLSSENWAWERTSLSWYIAQRAQYFVKSDWLHPAWNQARLILNGFIDTVVFVKLKLF